MPIQTYKELDVWQVAVDLVEQIYLLTRRFPAAERFGLVAQMRRAAVSVPANIAEGYGRTH
jgi:four helix bundle protein